MNRGGFSWNRFLGISAAKSKLSRSIGIPLTKSGSAELGRMMMGGKCCLIPIVVGLLLSAAIIVHAAR